MVVCVSGAWWATSGAWVHVLLTLLPASPFVGLRVSDGGVSGGGGMFSGWGFCVCMGDVLLFLHAEKV